VGLRFASCPRLAFGHPMTHLGGPNLARDPSSDGELGVGSGDPLAPVGRPLFRLFNSFRQEIFEFLWARLWARN
jgi:hypothetical protein